MALLVQITVQEEEEYDARAGMELPDADKAPGQRRQAGNTVYGSRDAKWIPLLPFIGLNHLAPRVVQALTWNNCMVAGHLRLMHSRTVEKAQDLCRAESAAGMLRYPIGWEKALEEELKEAQLVNTWVITTTREVTHILLKKDRTKQ